MTLIHIYRDPKQCPFAWAEILDGRPVHPGELPERVKLLLAEQQFATCSELVLAIVGSMVKRGELPLPVGILYHHKDGTESENRFCKEDGLWLKPWPEEQHESIVDATFYHRYH